MARTLMLVATLLVAAGGIAAGFDVTACDTTVPPGEPGILQNDVSCSGALVAVALGDGATLDMQGHAISGTPTSNSAVSCRGRRCRVTGPGDISGPVIAISVFNGRQRLTASDLTINDCLIGVLDVAPKPSTLVATNLSVTGCSATGLQVGKLRGSGITANGNGAAGIAVDRLRAENVVANDNGGAGIFGGAVRVTGLVANNNGDAGVRAVKAALRDATLTGNDGAGAGIDLLTKRRPRVPSDITCGKSGVLGGLITDTWGVCAGD